eukprot:7996053-Pyramimonas_sp.AAC.2
MTEGTPGVFVFDGGLAATSGCGRCTRTNGTTPSRPPGGAAPTPATSSRVTESGGRGPTAPAAPPAPHQAPGTPSPPTPPHRTRSSHEAVLCAVRSALVSVVCVKTPRLASTPDHALC